MLAQRSGSVGHPDLTGRTFPGYTALYTLVLNLVLAIVLTPLFEGAGARGARRDETLAADHHA